MTTTDEPRIMKLDPSRIGLVARDHEMSILQDVFNRVVASSNPPEKNNYNNDGDNDSIYENSKRDDIDAAAAIPENDQTMKKKNNNDSNNGPSLVFLEGESGCGKSYLIEQFIEQQRKLLMGRSDRRHNSQLLQQQQQQKQTLLYGSGKFEEATTATKPFSAIVNAVDSLIANLIQTSPSLSVDECTRSRDEWRHRLRTELKSHTLPILRRVLPSLDDLFNNDETNDNVETQNTKIHKLMMDNNDDESKETTDEYHGRDNIVNNLPNAIAAPNVRRRSLYSQNNDDDDDNHNSTAFHNQTVGEDSEFDHLRFAMRSLLRCLSRPEYDTVVVLFLDDIQWASVDCSELLRTFFMMQVGEQDKNKYDDSKSPLDDPNHDENFSLMIICAYRPSQGAMNKALLDSLKLLKANSTDNRSVRFMSLKNLNCNEVAVLASSLLNRDVKEIIDDGFSTVVHRKTGGNPFFVIQYLLSLENLSLVYYDTVFVRWTWAPVEEIAAKTELNTNVVTLVAEMIRSDASLNVRDVLMAASCLGVSSFDITILRDAIEAVQSYERNHSNIKGTTNEQSDRDRSNSTVMELQEIRSSLSQAVNDRYLEPAGRDSYRFSHDRVRESAYSLISRDKVHEWHLAIGRYLLQRFAEESGNVSEIDDERLLLHCTSQYNHSTHLLGDAEEILIVSELNLEAGMFAMKLSSFFPALDFVEKGISMLTFDVVSTDERALELRSKLNVMKMRLLFRCGSRDECLKLAEEVLVDATNANERLIAYLMKSTCLFQHLGDAKQATEQIHAVLAELGIKVPGKRMVKIQTMRLIQKLRKKVASMTDIQLMSLPKSKNQLQYGQSLFIERLIDFSAINGEHWMFTFALVRYFQILLEGGSSQCDTMQFAAFAWALVDLDHIDESYRMAKIALQLVKKSNDMSYHDCRAVLVLYLQVMPWRNPVHDGLEPTADALQRLWLLGKIDAVMQDGVHYSWLYLCCGLKLQPLAVDLENYYRLLKDYEQEHSLITYLPYMQLIENLTHEDSHGTLFIGTFMNQEVDIPVWKKVTPFLVQLVYHCRMIVAYILNDLNLAERMTSNMEENHPLGAAYRIPLLFYSGLVWIALAKKSNDRSYRRKGKEMLKRFQKWVEGGAINWHHMYMLLKAESMAAGISKHTADDIGRAYDDAIVSAARVGFIHNNAIASERAGVYYLENGDPVRAGDYLVRAQSLYDEWGAVKKVSQMNEKYKDVPGFISNRTQLHGRSLKSKSRLTSLSTERYRMSW